MEILTLLAKELIGYGAIGMLALMGWTLSGWFLYRDHKSKGTRSEVLQIKDDQLAAKDVELAKVNKDFNEKITKLSEERIDDLKEVTSEYNSVLNANIQTMDKLTVALRVRPEDIH
jgi:hypothetical protein